MWFICCYKHLSHNASPHLHKSAVNDFVQHRFSMDHNWRGRLHPGSQGLKLTTAWPPLICYSDRCHVRPYRFTVFGLYWSIAVGIHWYLVSPTLVCWSFILCQYQCSQLARKTWLRHDRQLTTTWPTMCRLRLRTLLVHSLSCHNTATLPQTQSMITSSK